MYQKYHTISNFIKVLLLLVFSAVTLTSCTSVRAADVPVPNGGFENAGTSIAHWEISDASGSKSTFAVQRNLVRNGGQAFQLTKTNRDGFVVLQSDYIPVTAKSTFQASAWLNIKTISDANIYFRITQFKTGSDKEDLPNIFGMRRPLYSTDGKWEKFNHIFTVRPGIDRVQISLVFARAPIEVYVDDVQLTNLGDYKPRYEPTTPETLIPQADAEKVLLARPRATAEVKTIGQRPRLLIDGKESIPAFYKGAPYPGTNSQINDLREAGVNIYLVRYILGRGVYRDYGAWSSKDKTDFSELDDILWRVLRADPNGYIIINLATDPYPAWGAEHLDDVVTDQNGNKAIVDTQHFLRWGGEPDSAKKERYGYSYVSSHYRNDAEKVLLEFDQHIKNSLPGKAVIGYHVIGGNDGQMFIWGDYGTDRQKHLIDYSPASLHAFRKWLEAKYINVANLRNSWHQPAVTFDTAQIPSAERRLSAQFFLDPKTEQDIADFNRFYSEGTVDTLNGFAKALRQSHGTPIILGTYYAGPTSGIASHMATEYLLKKGMYDYVTSVLAYDAMRWPGAPGKAHQAWESLLLHSTLGVTEEDFRTWKTKPGTLQRNTYTARVTTAADINAMMRRDTGRMLAYGQGAWWYDMDGGWFSDPSIMKAVKESTDAFTLDLKDNNLPGADVAVFIDETSTDYINHKNAPAFRYSVLNKQIMELNSSGVPFHLYLQNDISNPKLPDYKLYVFLDAYHLTNADWDAIQKLRRDGKTICFMHAPGVVSQNLLRVNNAAAAIEKITGIHVTGNGEQSVALQPAPKSTFDGGKLISYDNIKVPTFAVDDANAKVVADYAFNNKPAVAMRDFGSWKSVFFGGVGMDAFFFNSLARQAGAWVAAPVGNAVYANQHFLTIHAMYPGEKAVQLLQPSKVTDMADGKVLSSKTQTLHLDMQRGETRWFYLQQP